MLNVIFIFFSSHLFETGFVTQFPNDNKHVYLCNRILWWTKNRSQTIHVIFSCIYMLVTVHNVFSKPMDKIYWLNQHVSSSCIYVSNISIITITLHTDVYFICSLCAFCATICCKRMSISDWLMCYLHIHYGHLFLQLWQRALSMTSLYSHVVYRSMTPIRSPVSAVHEWKITVLYFIIAIMCLQVFPSCPCKHKTKVTRDDDQYNAVPHIYTCLCIS